LYALAAKYGMADKDYSAVFSFLKRENMPPEARR
jgi:hypothetical protein